MGQEIAGAKPVGAASRELRAFLVLLEFGSPGPTAGTEFFALARLRLSQIGPERVGCGRITLSSGETIVFGF